MREIKFRAWDKQNKCWYEPVQEAYKFRLWELLICFSGELHAWTFRGSEAGLLHESSFPGRYKLMQYTGLKDKNGKEIYEGDVVRMRTGRDYSEIRVVEFRDGAFRYQDQNTPHAGFMYANKFTEVIGNVYENPELLEA